MAAGEVTVPAAGVYLVNANMFLTSTSTANPYAIQARLVCGATTELFAAQRFSGTTSHWVHTACVRAFSITTPATQKISLSAFDGSGPTMGVTGFVRSLLSIVRVA
jgi:hypothetical protein